MLATCWAWIPYKRRHRRPQFLIPKSKTLVHRSKSSSAGFPINSRPRRGLEGATATAHQFWTPGTWWSGWAVCREFRQEELPSLAPHGRARDIEKPWVSLHWIPSLFWCKKRAELSAVADSILRWWALHRSHGVPPPERRPLTRVAMHCLFRSWWPGLNPGVLVWLNRSRPQIARWMTLVEWES
jgi:hypothetical protein